MNLTSIESSVSAFALSHPEVVLFVLTGVFSWLTKNRTEADYITMNPRVAAVLKMIASLGLDTPKLVRQIQQLISGKPVNVPGFVVASQVADPTPSPTALVAIPAVPATIVPASSIAPASPVVVPADSSKV